MKKLITFATAASLLMGGMTVPVYAAAFADINTVTWDGFKPFLEQAAELKLMSGYEENGKKYCKPRNNVTYCEAVQLMYSIMKVYSGQDVNDSTVTKWKPVISAYNIPEWAYKATAYALENSILTTGELNKLQGNANKINTKAATREDVGVIFGKALDTVKGYDIKSGATLSYADKSKISSAAVPYLELLNRAGLMVGDTDNKFNPKANISRAEMAVLSVKSYNKLTETGTTTPETTKETTTAGTIVTRMVMQNGDLFISMKTNTGTNLSLFGAKGSLTAKYDGEKIDFSDVGEGDTVKVTYTGTNMSALEVVYSKAGIDGAKEEEKKEDKTTEETYELEDITDSKVYVLDGSKEKNFRLDDDVKVTLDGKKSSVDKLADALEDAEYDVTLTLDEDEYVLKVEAVLNDNNPTEGYVEDADEDEITIKVGTKEYTYPLAEDVEVEYDGKSMRFSKFMDECVDYNYYVTMELNKDREVDEIVVESMEDEYNGTLTFINSKRIEIEVGGETHTYDLDEDVEVKIDGKKSSVSELRDAYKDDKDYRVSLDTNRGGDVTEILATLRNATNNDGELVDIDENEVTVDVDGKEYTYDIAKDVDVTINNKDRDLEDLIDHVSDYTFAVKLGFDKDDEVCEIDAVLEEVNEGELRDLIPEKDFMTVVAAGLNIDLELASNVEATLDGEELSMDELNDELDYAFGDSRIWVELEYNKNGEVTEVTANWEDEFGELVEVDEEDDEIIVKIDGDKEEFVVDRDAEFVFRIGSNVDEDDYDDADDYDEDLDGLYDFLYDCDKAGDKCMVALTLDSRDDVLRIKATAQ